jgi:hypothetical protein
VTQIKETTMSAELSSGLPWLIIDVGAVLILGFAVVYGIAMWNRRRKARASGVMQAPGPAPKQAEQRDQRRVAG